MEQLRKLGAVGRQHYEKLVLTAALLILAGAVWFLNESRRAEQEKIKAIPGDFKTRKVKPVRATELADATNALRAAERPTPVQISGGHNLFNPVEWRLDRVTGQPSKIKSERDVGPHAMTVVKISPLHLHIVYGSPSTSVQDEQVTVLGYLTYSTNETVAVNSLRPPRRVSAFVSINATNPQAVFILREVKGDPKEPTELIGELKDFGGEKFSFAPGKPYTRVLAHEAELRYKPNPEKKYDKLREGVNVDIDGQIYKVVDITPDRVVLSDDSNGKQYTIPAR